MNFKPRPRKTKRSRPVGGQVGIFWWNVDRVLAVCANVRKDVDVDYRFYHETVWPTIQYRDPKLVAIRSDDLPQGRVYFLRAERRFWVRMDRELFEPQVQAAILKAFRLPKQATEFGVHDRKGIHDRY